MWLKICGGALLCAVAILLIKSAKGDVLPLQWAGILLMSGAGIALWQPVLSFVSELCTSYGVDETAGLLFKGLGVAVLTQLCADLCRQTGEGLLASGVEMAGRAELLVLCLPLLRRLVGLAAELLGALSA